MNKLKYVRIQREDGSYGDKIPFYVDGATVEINGQSLTTKINEIDSSLQSKVVKQAGKGLSANNYTNEEKQKLNGIEAGATNTEIDSTLSVEGAAADAKAVGDKINLEKTILQQTINTQAEHFNTEIIELQSLVGSPLVATTAAEMTDIDKIYVYVGSETGYINGNWYYWNGSAWTSGGVYNAVAFETDKTLSVKDMAADAKVVGDTLIKNNLLTFTEYTDASGYISNRGVIATNGQWMHTEPIVLKKLETISFTGTSVNSGIAMISLVNASGDVLNPVVFGVDSTVRTYEYTAVNDCYVSVSHVLTETDIKKGIKQDTIQKSYSELEMYIGKNLVDANDTVDGFYKNIDGLIYSQDLFCYTKHFIKCLPNTAYATTHNGTIFICYYDSNLTYLSGTTANATTFITPNNARYMCISFAIQHKNDCMVCLASEKNRNYAPYVRGYSIKNVPNAQQINHIYVGADKDYQTITSALNAITDATEFNRYIIHVSKGTYQETFSTKDYVDIVGDDKYKTIINYTSNDESQYVNQSTIFATSFSKLENLTITTTGTKYPVHCDGAYGIPYRVIIRNCILKHNGFTTLPTQAGTAIGIGLYENQHIEIIDSECIASGVFGCASIYCHNANDIEAKSGYRSIRVEHSTLSNATYGFRLEAIEQNDYQDNDAWLIEIINNGETPIRNTHVSKESWHLFQYS